MREERGERREDMLIMSSREILCNGGTDIACLYKGSLQINNNNEPVRNPAKRKHIKLLPITSDW